MALANQEAYRLNHEYIGTEHILLGLGKEGSGLAADVLKNLNVDLRRVRLEVEKLVERGPELVVTDRPRPTASARQAIEYAVQETYKLDHRHVGTEHVLLGILRERDGVAAQALHNLGLRFDDVRGELINLVSAPRKSPAVDDGLGS